MHWLQNQNSFRKSLQGTSTTIQPKEANIVSECKATHFRLLCVCMYNAASTSLRCYINNIDVNAFECKYMQTTTTSFNVNAFRSVFTPPRCTKQNPHSEKMLYTYIEIVKKTGHFFVHLRNINSIMMIVKPATATAEKIRTAAALAIPALKCLLLPILTMVKHWKLKM